MIANSGEKEDRDKLWEALSNRPNAEDIVRAGRSLYKSILGKDLNDPIMKYEKIGQSFNTLYYRFRKMMKDPNEPVKD